MLETTYLINFLGMTLLPIIAAIYLSRKFKLSWKLFLAGGLTFIASQILHIPLVLALTSTMLSWGIIPYAIVLGLLAGIFEETARYILFKFIRKDSKTWNEGVFIGLGHGGTEAIIFGILAAVGFFTMLAYRSMDLSTIPSIPADQLELAKQQVAAYWSTPVYMTLLGAVERIFAICLHISLSVMVLYSIVNKKPGLVLDCTLMACDCRCCYSLPDSTNQYARAGRDYWYFRYHQFGNRILDETKIFRRGEC